MDFEAFRVEAMCVCTMIDGEGLLTSAEDAILLAEEALDLCLDVQDALFDEKKRKINESQ